jgi:hypothetical protein
MHSLPEMPALTDAPHRRRLGLATRHLQAIKPSSSRGAASSEFSSLQRAEHEAGGLAHVDGLLELIESKMAEYGITGVAFGLCKDGVAACGGFGVTNIDNPQP